MDTFSVKLKSNNLYYGFTYKNGSELRRVGASRDAVTNVFKLDIGPNGDEQLRSILELCLNELITTNLRPYGTIYQLSFDDSELFEIVIEILIKNFVKIMNRINSLVGSSNAVKQLIVKNINGINLEYLENMKELYREWSSVLKVEQSIRSELYLEDLSTSHPFHEEVEHKIALNAYNLLDRLNKTIAPLKASTKYKKSKKSKKSRK